MHSSPSAGSLSGVTCGSSCVSCGTLGTSSEFSLTDSAGATCHHWCLRSHVWSPCLTLTSRFSSGVGPLLTLLGPCISWTSGPPQVWICADRPLDGHNLMFETLCQLESANPLYVSCFPAFVWLLQPFVLHSTTFKSFCSHFAVTGLMAKLSTHLNKFLTLSNTFSLWSIQIFLCK